MKYPRFKGLLFALICLALPAAGYCHSIDNIVFDITSPATLEFGENITVTFDYETEEAGGVRIWARPMTCGGTTTNYAAQGSPVYPVGTGNGSGYFTITQGANVVDQVRFQMKNEDQSVMLLEIFVDVNYSFASPGCDITNIVFSPPSPEDLEFNEHVDVTFDYETAEASGVRIWARPMTGCGTTPHYAAHASPLHPMGTGSGSGYFTITEGTVMVDQVRFQMWNSDESVLLLVMLVDVNYSFDTGVSLISRSWGQFKSLYR